MTLDKLVEVLRWAQAHNPNNGNREVEIWDDTKGESFKITDIDIENTGDKRMDAAFGIVFNS